MYIIKSSSYFCLYISIIIFLSYIDLDMSFAKSPKAGNYTCMHMQSYIVLHIAIYSYTYLHT